jgi:hypothetical protein
MEKRILHVRNSACYFLLLFALQSNLSGQKHSVHFEPRVGLTVIDTNGIVVDTICTDLYPMTIGVDPVYCQNDSVLVVLYRNIFTLATRYSLVFYSKREPYSIIESYHYNEWNKHIWQKTQTYSERNKIVISFNDCSEVTMLLEFDPYTMTLQDARKQFLENLRKI